MTDRQPAPFDYDAELALHNELLRAATDVGVGDHVLDIGCGTGLTTREAARAARSGSATGVDVSEHMIDRARELARTERVDNVGFEKADAQTHSFPAQRYDLCISRFGAMFFRDPTAAFANIQRALRPGARLVMLVWQATDRNAWVAAIREPGTPAPVDGAGMFSLADPDAAERILVEAGFSEVAFDEVDEPVFYGQDGETAFNAVRSLWRDPDLTGIAPSEAEQARSAVRDYLESHRRSDGVFLESHAWMVTALKA